MYELSNNLLLFILFISFISLIYVRSVEEELAVDLGVVELMSSCQRQILLRNTSAIQADYRVVVKHFKARPPTPPHQQPGATVVKT